MAANEDALALKLVHLVTPNWPNLQATDISVLNLKACITRATPEQRQTARECREVLEQIWAMDEDAPVRRLLEGLCRPAESTDGHVLAGSEAVTPPAAPRHVRQLPNELVLRVLHFLLPDDDWPRDIEVATLGCVRAVSKSIKHLAETRFPNTLHRYVARIVRKLLHGQASPVHVSRLAHASAPLLKRCKELRIWVAGDEVEKLNNLLEVFEAMETLVVYVTSKDAIFSGVDLTVCRSLRTVRIHCVDTSEDREDADDADHRKLGDVFVVRNIDMLALDCYRDQTTDLRSGLVRLELGYVPFDCQALYTSLAGMEMLTEIQSSKYAETTAAHVDALGLDRLYGPSKLDFQFGMDEDAVELLALGHKVALKTLLLGHECGPIDPAVLALRTNKSLVHLSPGPLQSANLDLDLNKHLRHLDLSKSFRRVEGGILAALRELGTQLAVNTTLQVLQLGYNGITDKAALALRLDENKGLKRLLLAHNSLSDAGLRAALHGNTKLTLVDVRWNKVTEACAEELSSGERRVIVREDDTTWEDTQDSWE